MTSKLTSDCWVKCISTQGSIRGIAIQATHLVQSMADRHGLSGEGAKGLGEAVIGALLFGAYCKVGQRINLNIQGSGYIKQALVDAYPEGQVRGYIIERKERVDLPENVGPWGTGLLSLLRTRNEEGGKPYIGTVPLLTGHLAKDLSFYWVQSEQIPSAVGLAVNLSGQKVVSAGGFLVQALPGASPTEVKTVEEHIREIHSLASKLEEYSTPLHMLSEIFQSTPFMVLEEKPIEFKCNCSWEKVQRSLALVGIAELQSILSEDNYAAVHCDFCAKEYRVEGSEIEKLIQVLKN